MVVVSVLSVSAQVNDRRVLLAELPGLRGILLDSWPMLRIDERERRITTRSGGGGLLLFGLVFAGFGMVFIFLLLTGGDVIVNDRPGRLGDVWFPAIFVLIGLAIAFSRYRREIDFSRGEIRSTFSCLVPLYRSRERLGRLREVRLSREVRRGKNRRTTVYPVRLVAEKRSYRLSSGRDELAARREAEAVARLAVLELADSTSGDEVVRSPDQLDLSVLELGDGEGEEEVPEPAGSRLAIEESIREVRIRVPVAGWFRFSRWAPYLFVPVALAFWWLAWRPAAGDGDDDPLGRLFLYLPLVLFLGIPLVVITVRALRSQHRTHHLVVDRRGLSTRRLFGSLTIPAGELEELEVREGPACLLARSDTVQFRCGHGLSEDELAHLRQVILRRLRGR